MNCGTAISALVSTVSLGDLEVPPYLRLVWVQEVGWGDEVCFMERTLGVRWLSSRPKDLCQLS